MTLLQLAVDTTATHKHEAVEPWVFAIALALAATVSAVITYRAVLALAARGLDDRGQTTSWALLKTFPSTSGRIIVELTLAILFVVGCMVADMIGRPVSETTQETLGLFIAAMLGIGAGQFFGKRKTDADYVAAKGANPPPASTTVNAQTATVDVNTPAPAAPPPQQG